MVNGKCFSVLGLSLKAFVFYTVFVVVNLTLIDLPGLTKVAVGNITTKKITVCLNKPKNRLTLSKYTNLQKDNLKVLSQILKIWCDHMSRRLVTLHKFSMSPRVSRLLPFCY
jgi:gamma-glutamylcysteine synthetase